MTTRRKLASAIALGLLMCGSLVAVMTVAGYRPRDWVAHYLGGNLPSVPDEFVAAELQRFSELDDVGLLVVVDALGSERARVTESAAAALDQQLNRWSELPPDQSSRLVAGLAQALARRADRWSAEARSAASDLALRILDWPLDGRRVQRAAVIADCEHVLRLHGTDMKAVSTVPPRAMLRPQTSTPWASRDVSPQPRIDLSAVEIPGGDLPVDKVDFPTVPAPVTTVPEPRSLGDHEPSLLPTPGPSATLSDRWSGGESSGAPADLRPRQTPGEADSLLRPLSNDVPAGADLNLEKLADRAVFSHLDGQDADRTALAEDILRRRGYQTRDLALARRLTSADVATRQQLVETVARLPAAGRWLVWLSEDPSPVVRSAAVSVLVTAQDPRVRRRLLDMEINEPDDDIRQQLRKWRETLRE